MLRDQVEMAHARRKGELKERMTALRSDYADRNDKLREAQRLTREALVARKAETEATAETPEPA